MHGPVYMSSSDRAPQGTPLSGLRLSASPLVQQASAREWLCISNCVKMMGEGEGQFSMPVAAVRAVHAIRAAAPGGELCSAQAFFWSIPGMSRSGLSLLDGVQKPSARSWLPKCHDHLHQFCIKTDLCPLTGLAGQCSPICIPGRMACLSSITALPVWWPTASWTGGSAGEVQVLRSSTLQWGSLEAIPALMPAWQHQHAPAAPA